MIDDWFDGPELEAAKSVRSTILNTEQKLNMLDHSIFDKGLILLAYRAIRDYMLDSVAKLSLVLEEIDNNEWEDVKEKNYLDALSYRDPFDDYDEEDDDEDD